MSTVFVVALAPSTARRTVRVAGDVLTLKELHQAMTRNHPGQAPRS
jgi:hypothetical protein